MAVPVLLRPMRLKQRNPGYFSLVRSLVKHVEQFGMTSEDEAAFKDGCSDIANYLLGALPPPEQERILNTGLEHVVGAVDLELTAAFLFKLYGSNAFMLSSDVVKALRSTDLAEVRVGDIQLPFGCIYVAFDPDNSPIDGFFLEGAYIYELDDGLVIRVCFQADRSALPNWVIDPGINVIVRGTDNAFSLALEAYLAECEAHTAAYMDDPKWGRDGQDKTGSRRSERPTSVRYSNFVFRNRQRFTEALALIASAACLLTALPEDLVGPMVCVPPRTARGSNVLKAEPGSIEARYVTFGKKTPGNHIGEHTERSPRAHWRRGHWRRQPYGSGELRAYRPRWIRPSLVNASVGSPAQNSFYSVEAS